MKALFVIILANLLTTSLAHSLCGGAISESIITHVLEDDVAVVVLVSTGVLVGPLDGEDGTLVVIHVPNVVASTVVVL